jgi:hypothetical protein
MLRIPIGSDERSELTDALEGPDRPASAAHLRGIGTGLLEAIALAWGLAVVNAAILFKIGWTFLFSTEAGAMSHLPAAVLGLVVCDALILYIMRSIRARSSYGRPRPGEHHG